MTARTRVLATVAAAACVAVAATVGATLVLSRGQGTTVAGAVTKPRAGKPPLELSFGLRTDPEARALAQALTLYDAKHYVAAEAIFSRYDSLEAEIGAAFAAWPGHGLDTLKRLVSSHPTSSLAELHLGLAYFQSGRNADAIASWKKAETLEPDTPYALTAATLLHPSMPDLALPIFVPSSRAPAGVTTVQGLARLAATRDVPAKIYYGIALQTLGYAVSAERQFEAAARLAPDDPEALTAAAVGRFTKAQPARAFSQLGPLAKRFPRAAVVRFHLGYLLIWLGDKAQAAKELRLAVADGPRTVYAREGTVLLAS